MSSPPSSSSGLSASFSLLDTRIQRWIWEKGWGALRDAQERAIPFILSGTSDVIIAAATASGKTEAAFLPILTHLLANPNGLGCALYISPLKALINDQWGRLEDLCATLEVPVTPWHGDISASRKQKFLRTPTGVLLITPESLEGLLMREGHALSGLLGGVDFLVIDELHAFIDSERGKQLQSLMHRVELALGRRVPRIGLSATLGEMQLAADFLRPPKGAGVQVIEGNEAAQDVRVVVKGYREVEPLGDEAEGADLAIARDLFAALRGANNLIFPNSRRGVELCADMLRRQCAEAGVPNEFWPHHGSLSKEIREETEGALKKGDHPATAIATTTLELGIDIGTVKSVAQIGPGPSVAGLRQRLGRSGRRAGEAATLRCYCAEPELVSDMALSDQLREGLIQAVAQIQLLAQRWYEPPRGQGLHLSTFIQQLLSLISQRGGVTAKYAWTVLCESGVFPGISSSEFLSLLRFLGENEILVQDSSGLLLHGAVGERLVNHYSFLAAFTSSDEFRIVHGSRSLGTLPLNRPVDAGTYIIFAGRRWLVLSCEPKERLIQVEAAAGGKLPKFDGMGGKVHDRVREEMRMVLAGEAPIAFADPTAMSLISEARAAYGRFRLSERVVIRSGDGVRVFTWRGDWVNDTLALMLTRRGLRAANEGLSLSVAKCDVPIVLTALRDIAESPIPRPETLVDVVQTKLKEKWDHLLPDQLLARNYASRELDAPGAHAAALRVLVLNQAAATDG